MSATENPSVAYIRRMLSGEDIGFDRGNRDWNPERLSHLIECLGTATRLLDKEQFVIFHGDYSEDFNFACASCELAQMRDDSWFDQESSKEHCAGLLNSVVVLINVILSRVSRV
jgi:hypothetical protein